MSKNVGKIFEEDFAKSISSDWFCHRLKDTAQSYNASENTKFSWENPFDYMLFDGSVLYCIELKSTSEKYMTFQIDENDKSKKMIKWHQIESLTEASEYKNVIAGFLLNFRLEKEGQITYFFDIKDFNKMREKSSKKSFNIMDAVLNGAVKVQGAIKRTRYRWDVCPALSQYKNNINNENN